MTGVSTLPDLERDATDRNRTSPFAFTGNKFEFRMVGSSDSVAGPNTALNAIVAEAFCEAADELEKADDFELAVHDMIKDYFTEHQRIIFNGDGYSESWVKEAARRGLPNIASMVESVDALLDEDAVAMFEKFRIFTRAELESRSEVLYEIYSKSINIEAHTMIDMTGKQILPAVMRYAGRLAADAKEVREAGGDDYVMSLSLRQCTGQIRKLQEAFDKLKEDVAAAARFADKNKLADKKEQAQYYRDVICADMAALRAPADALEMMVDKNMWPFPTYGDLIFEV